MEYFSIEIFLNVLFFAYKRQFIIIIIINPIKKFLI